MSLVASTSKPPLGSTWVTRAVSVVDRVVVRLVVPWPLIWVLPAMFARLASAPVALVMPARAAMLFWVLEARCVLVLPVLTAEACSATTTVSTSSTWLARTSRAASARREPASQMEPGVVAADAAERRASASGTQRARRAGGLGAAVGFFSLWPLAAGWGAPPARPSETARIRSRFMDSPWGANCPPRRGPDLRHAPGTAGGKRDWKPGSYRRASRKLRRELRVKRARRRRGLRRERSLRGPRREAPGARQRGLKSRREWQPAATCRPPRRWTSE